MSFPHGLVLKLQMMENHSPSSPTGLLMGGCLSLTNGVIFCPREEAASLSAAPPPAVHHCNGPSRKHLDVIWRKTAPSSNLGLFCQCHRFLTSPPDFCFPPALPGVRRAPHGPGRSLLASVLFHCPPLMTLPPSSLFLQDHGCGSMNSSGPRPRDAAGFMDVLNGTYSQIPWAL